MGADIMRIMKDPTCWYFIKLRRNQLITNLSYNSPMMTRNRIAWTSSIISTVSLLEEIFILHLSAQILSEYWT